MKRKVAKIGPSTLMISLPNKWAKKFNIKKGDEVDITERNKSLIIKINKGKELKNITLDAREPNHFHKNQISDLYKKGYDEIDVFFDNEQTFKDVKDRVSNLMGYEIIDHGERSCKIKSISEELEEEFENVLRRTFFVLIDMSDSILDALKNEDFKRLNEIKIMEKTTDKLTDFCLRIINKHGYRDDEDKSFIYLIIRDLERIGDDYRDICETIINTKNFKISKGTMELLSEVNNYFKLFYESFYKPEKARMKEFYSNKKRLIDISNRLIKKDNPQLAHYLQSLTKNIFDIYGPLFNINISK